MRSARSCSAASLEAREMLAGTAPQFAAAILMEEPGAWGRNAWRDARLPAGLGEEVLSRCAAADVRPLLIRRAAPIARPTRTLFAVRIGRATGAVEQTELADPRQILDLDIAALGRGVALGLTPHQEPIFAVCVHGKHDQCCAARGRPALAALAAAEPDASWAVSHIGGHRFSANLVVFGSAIYYGGVDAKTAPHIAQEYRAGRLVTSLMRGRAGLSGPEQVAEITVRRHLAADEVGAVRLLSCATTQESAEVSLSVNGRVTHVNLRRQEYAALTSCRDAAPSTVASWRVTSCDC